MEVTTVDALWFFNLFLFFFFFTHAAIPQSVHFAFTRPVQLARVLCRVCASVRRLVAEERPTDTEESRSAANSKLSERGQSGLTSRSEPLALTIQLIREFKRPRARRSYDSSSRSDYR